MAHAAPGNGEIVRSEPYDAVIVGASLAGSTAAIILGRAGARVALVDQRPEAGAFKRICSHYIQSSGVATLERVGLLEPMLAAGAVRSRGRIWTRWGWIAPPDDGSVPSGLNLRRELLDPLIRTTAARTPGVELLLGHSAQELMRAGLDGDRGAVRGIAVRDRAGDRVGLEAKVVIGADGRDSRVAKLADVRRRTYRHGRFAYGGYFEGPAPAGAPDASLWFLDPDMAAAFPTDSGLTFYACMPTMDRLAEFRGDPERALRETLEGLPDSPPIGAARLVGQMQGKIDMTNVAHRVTAPGLALIGDAALAVDPLWGVGCGWALQSGEWLADAVAPALAGSEPPRRGLARYRRRHARALRGHAMMIYGYATGRRMDRAERLLFRAAAEDVKVGRAMEAFGSRNIGPGRMMARAMPRAVAGTALRSLRRGVRGGPEGESGRTRARVSAGAR